MMPLPQWPGGFVVVVVVASTVVVVVAQPAASHASQVLIASDTQAGWAGDATHWPASCTRRGRTPPGLVRQQRATPGRPQMECDAQRIAGVAQLDTATAARAAALAQRTYAGCEAASVQEQFAATAARAAAAWSGLGQLA